jgi:glycosyltransferase involved in cell wall biosynthesis
VKILFLSHYFPPEVNAPASRTFEHCRLWVQAGHQVTVVTCVPNHPHGRVFPGYRNRLYATEERDGIRIVRLLTYATANAGFLKRIFNYALFMMMATLAAPFLRCADVVVTTSPQFFNGLAGYAVSRIKRCPWVLEIRDLWPESILTVSAIRNRRIIRFLERLEEFAYRKADGIISVTESFVEHIRARGGRGKITVIRNGADLKMFGNRLYDRDFARDLRLEAKFVGAYVGTHGMAHGLDTLIDAARKLTDRPDIAILMVGDGAEKRRLEARVNELGLNNIVMLDQQPKEMMPRIWSICDISLVLLRKSELFTKVIPSKIFESMAMGKPIVLGVRGESLELLKAANAGIGVEPENADELADTIRRLADDKALCHRLGTNGQAYVRANFDRRQLAAKFLALLERMTSSSKASRAGVIRSERPL